MAVSLATIASGYLHESVADTVQGLDGIGQHAQNLLLYRSEPSAIRYIDVEMDQVARTISIYADLHNTPTKEDVQQYTNSLGNEPGMAVTPGSNQKGHGGTAGFHADAKVGLLGAKAGDLFMLGLPQTEGMVQYMHAEPLTLGAGEHQKTYNGKRTINLVVYAQRTNSPDEAVGKYKPFIPEAEKKVLDRFHYAGTCEWLDGFLQSVGSSLDGAFAAVFDKLKGANGLCVHYQVLQDHGFETQTFADGVTRDIVIAKAGEPPLRLSHVLAKQFDAAALQGRVFRINGQEVDMAPLCPTSQPVLFGPIQVRPAACNGIVSVTVHSNAEVDINDADIVCKLGPLLLPDHCVDDRLAAIRAALDVGARFSGTGRPLVDKASSTLQPYFLQLLKDASGMADLPQRLRQFVVDVCEYDTEVGNAGLEFFRLVFGLNRTFLVADIGSNFRTNNTKTGLFDPVRATNSILAVALPALWIGMLDQLPQDYAAGLVAFRAKREQAAKDKADKAAALQSARAARAAAQAAARAAAQAAETPAGRGIKRKAAVEASKHLAEPRVPTAAELDKLPPRGARASFGAALPKATPPGATLKAAHAALKTELQRVKAENESLKAENDSLKAKLSAAGLLELPATAPVLAIMQGAAM